MATNWNHIFPNADQNESVEYLINGRKYFDRVIAEIAKLKSGDAIYIMGWMFEHDFFMDGKNTAESVFTNAISNGVEIKLLIWNHFEKKYISLNDASANTLNSLGIETLLVYSQFPATSTTLTANLRKLLVYANIVINYPLGVITPFSNTLQDLRDEITTINSLRPFSISSYHDKVTIIIKDQEAIAYCGGIDYNHNRLVPYNDLQCRVKGPAAELIYEKFIAKWNFHSITKIIPKTLTPASLSETMYPFALAVGNENYPQSSKGKNAQFDRTLKKSYTELIKNAESYIFIQDQYMTNYDVASELNIQVREKKDLIIILLIQCDEKTTEILLPAKARQQFINVLENKLNKDEKKRIYKFTVDHTKMKTAGMSDYSTLHSKLIIVDDEIAIIGSSNVNYRSFTYDSETSLLFFGYSSEEGDTIAKKLRMELWTDYATGSGLKPAEIESVTDFANKIVNGKSRIDYYVSNVSHDFDEKANAAIRAVSSSKMVQLLNQYGLPLGNLVNVLSAINTSFCGDLYKELIDPKA